MLQKTKSKSISKFKYLLLIPVITSILTYTSCSDNTGSDDNTFSSNSENTLASTCLNQNAVYDKTIDNFLELEAAKNTEMIVELINIETAKSIRKAHIEETQKYTMRNIPEGKYKLDITYGKGYKEETINGNCLAYFNREITKENSEDIIDFNTKETSKGLDIPSYALIIDQSTPTERLEEDDDIKPIDESSFNCLNTNGSYNKSLDNYLELATATNTEVILKLILIETEKVVRTVHLSERSKTYMRHIPEGKYQLHIDYGTEYIEKNSNGKCTASFKNFIKSEIGDGIIDFTITKDEKGLDIPSYELLID